MHSLGRGGGQGSATTRGGAGGGFKSLKAKSYRAASEDVERPKSRHGLNNGTRGSARGNAHGLASSRGRGRGVSNQTNGYPLHRRRSQDSQDSDTPTLTTPKPTGDDAYKRWKTLQARREKETKDAIENGLIWDQSRRGMRLEDARAPKGTCPTMCPEYERAERISNNDIWAQERDQNSLPDEKRMVKKFRRAAAGQGEALPSDLRPPTVLKRTMDFLVNDVIANAEWLGDVAKFVWDRTRMIRTDFTIQRVAEVKKDSSNIADVRIAMETYERCIRYHILSMHHNGDMAREAKPDYSWQQDLEQLESTFSTLSHMYDDHRKDYRSPNEVEIKSYSIVLAVRKATQSLEHDIQTKWPAEFINEPAIEVALELYNAAGHIKQAHGPLKPEATFPIVSANWKRFWSLVRSSQVSYLLACAAEAVFDIVRSNVLNAIWHGYNRGTLKPKDWTIEELRDVLGFDSPTEALEYCKFFGFTDYRDEVGHWYLDLGSVTNKSASLPRPRDGLKPQCMAKWIEPKRQRRNVAAIINGWSVAEAKKHHMMVEDVSTVPDKNVTGKGNTLFVTGKSDDEESEVEQDDSNDPSYVDGEEDDEDASDSDASATVSRTVKEPAVAPTQTKLNPVASAFQPFNGATNKSSSFGTPSFTPSSTGNTLDSITASTNNTSSTFSAFQSTPTASSTSSFGKPSNLSAFGKPSPPSPFSTANSVSQPAASGFTATSQVQPPQSAFASQTTPSSSPFALKPPKFTSPFAPKDPSPLGTALPLSRSPGAVTPPASATAPATSNKIGDIESKSASTPSAPPPKNPFGFSGTFPAFTGSRAQESPGQHSPPEQSASCVASFTNTGPPQSADPPVTSPITATIKSPTAPPTFPSLPTSVVEVSSPKPSASTFGPPAFPKAPHTGESSTPKPTAPQPSFASPFPKPALPQQPVLPSEPPKLTVSDQHIRTAKRSEIYESLAAQLMEEPDNGLMRQFIETLVGDTIVASMRDFEQEKLRNEADAFRQKKLAIKYWSLWRRRVTKMRCRKRRQRRKENMALMKARVQEVPAVNSAQALMHSRYRKGKEKMRTNGITSAYHASSSRTAPSPDDIDDELSPDGMLPMPDEMAPIPSPPRPRSKDTISPHRPISAAELFGVTPRKSVSRPVLDAHPTRTYTDERINKTQSAYFARLARDDGADRRSPQPNSPGSSFAASHSRKRSRHATDDGSAEDDSVSPPRSSVTFGAAISSRKRINSQRPSTPAQRPSFGPLAGLPSASPAPASRTSLSSTSPSAITAVDPRDAALLARVAKARGRLMGTPVPSVVSTPTPEPERDILAEIEEREKLDARPAYWYRESRFVKREDYGKAVLDRSRPAFSLSLSASASGAGGGSVSKGKGKERAVERVVEKVAEQPLGNGGGSSWDDAIEL